MNYSKYYIVLFAVLFFVGLSQSAEAAAVPHYYEELTACNTASADGTVLLTVSDSGDFDFISGKKYLVMAQGEHGADNAATNGGFKVNIGGTEQASSEFVHEAPSGGSCGADSAHESYLWFDVFTSDGTDTIQLQLSSPAGGTQYYDNLSIFVMEISDELDENVDWFYDSGGVDSTLGTAWDTSDDATITFTPSTDSDWMVLGTQQLTVSDITALFEGRLHSTFDGNYPTEGEEGEDATYDLPVNTFVRGYNLTSTSYTFKVQAQTVSSNDGGRQSSQIFALNLDKFDSHAMSLPYTDWGLLSTSEYNDNVETIDHTPISTGDIFVIGYQILFVDTGNDAEYRLRVEDNSSVMQDQPPAQTSSSYDFAIKQGSSDKNFLSKFTLENLNTNTHTIDLDSSSNGAITNSDSEMLISFSMESSAPTAIPDVQTNGNATTVSDLQIDLLWTDSSNSTETPAGFYIERESPIGGGYSNIATTINSTTAYSDLGGGGEPVSNSIYNYRILGYNVIGNSSSWSSAFSNTTLADFNESPIPNFVSGATTIDIDWTAPTGNGLVNGYKIERALTSGGWSTLVANTTNNNVIYNDTGLATNTSYNYRWSVHNEGGTGGLSSNFTGATLGNPTVPTGLVVDGGWTTPYFLHLNWTASSDGGYPPVSYKIERAYHGGSFSTVVNDTASTSTTYVDNVLPLEYHDYRISAWNGFGGSAASSIAFNVTKGVDVDDLLVLPHGTSTSQLNMTWSKPDGTDPSPTALQGYLIERETSVGGGWSTLVANDTSLHSHEDTGLSINTYYNYRVTANLAEGTTCCTSNTYSQTTFHLPDAVEVLTAVANGDFVSITLDWDVPTTLYGYIQGYMINFTTPEGDPLTIYTNSTGSSATVEEITGLTAGDDYSFRVSARTIHGINATTPPAIIANASAFTDFEIGNLDLSVPTPNPVFPVLFTLYSVNDTTSDLQIAYDSSYDLACDFDYVFGTNQTYTGLPETTISGTNVYTNFTLQNPDNGGIDVYCWDQLDNSTDGRYRITQSNDSIPMFSQYTDFQSGVFGTSGMFGALDLMTLLVVIISMIGFNRKNPAVGVIFMVILIGILAYFGLIQIPTIILGAIALIVMVAIISVRKN